MNLMSSRTLLLLRFAALVLVLPAPIQAWQLDDLRLKHVPMPAGLRLDAAKKGAGLMKMVLIECQNFCKLFTRCGCVGVMARDA